MFAMLRRSEAAFDSRLINWITILGGLAYLSQSLVYAHTQFSLLDEGAYLNKGYLFATGQYRLYQDYGPWTNHMPLAFLIPGYVQVIFGPGLRTGRYLAVLLGMLILLGLWIVGRRLGGRWWAALVVWAMAVNPAVIKLFSLANSQALVAALLVWILVLTLGEGRPLWQILAGSALAGFMLLTRVNMAPALVVLIVYLFWQYGWRIGFTAGLAAAVPVILGHALYWPGILRIWAHWLPDQVFTFLRPWGHPAGADPSWRPDVTPAMRVTSFFHGIRFHFLPLAGAASAWLLWPRREGSQSSAKQKTAIFLSLLLLVMVLAHMWAALGQDYCVFCYPVYLSFFSWLGLLLVAATFASWSRVDSKPHLAIVGAVLLLITAGVGFGTHSDIGRRMVSGDLVRSLLSVHAPRLQSLRILPGTIEVWGALANRYDLSYVEVVQRTGLVLQMLVTTVAGFLIGAGILVVAARLSARKSGQNTGALALLLLLLIGFILSPTVLLGGGYRDYDCGEDVIRRYETAGAHLAEHLPPGALVYWDGGDSTVPLLYLEQISLYPAQLNGDYSRRLGGEPDALMRYGFWSEELAHRWAPEADIILIEGQNYAGWLRSLVESGSYDELPPTPPLVACRNNSEIHIFRKNQVSSK